MLRTDTTMTIASMVSRNAVRQASSDKSLLTIFLTSVALVTFSILLLPSIESQTTLEQRLSISRGSHIQQHSFLPDDNLFPQMLIKQNGGKPNQQYEYTPSISYHVIFSTGCSIFQDWQSYVFFYHFLKSGQHGHVTRIASGCKGSDEQDIRRVFKEQIAIMDPERLHLHLTPDFSHVKPMISFKYFNKPFGVQHWFTHALGYPDRHALHDDTVVILMDPDQIILRPFTNDFTNSSESWRNTDPAKRKIKVEHGSPFAQQYGFGLQWKDKVVMNRIIPNSPVDRMDRREAFDYYMAMGPPYVATAKDMYAIVTKWCEVVPKVHDQYPHLLAEMFGYNLAAAHLGLRHTIAHSFAVSDPTAGGEGWKLIDKVSHEDVCTNYPYDELPHVLHYCQRYMLGKWFIGKYRLRKDFISCDAPLLTLPPPNIGVKYTYGLSPGDPSNRRAPQPGDRREYREHTRKYYAFMVCTLIPALNDAAIYFKDHNCKTATANYDKTYVFFDDMTTEEDQL